MVNAVSFDLLFLPFRGKGQDGKRIYDVRVVPPDAMRDIYGCVQAAVFPCGRA
jgi:hypothetical protein